MGTWNQQMESHSQIIPGGWGREMRLGKPPPPQEPFFIEDVGSDRLPMDGPIPMFTRTTLIRISRI